MKEQDPIAEARRYVANAAEIIQKSKLDPKTELYKDKKYVRIAGDTLWKGCLIALDAVFEVRKGKGRPSIEKYKEAVGKRDRKLLDFVNVGYETMHLCMGYDGNKDQNNVLVFTIEYLVFLRFVISVMAVSFVQTPIAINELR